MCHLFHIYTFVSFLKGSRGSAKTKPPSSHSWFCSLKMKLNLKHFWGFHAPRCMFLKNPTSPGSEDSLPAPSLQQKLSQDLEKVEPKTSLWNLRIPAGLKWKEFSTGGCGWGKAKRFSGLRGGGVSSPWLLLPLLYLIWIPTTQDSFQRDEETGMRVLCRRSTECYRRHCQHFLASRTPGSGFPKTCPWGSSEFTWISLSWHKWAAVFGV